MADNWIHIPTPGDHYSPATGSAVMTVVYELTRCHAAAGGTTKIIVARGTQKGYAIGDRVEVDFPPLPTRNQKILDIATGRIGRVRRFSTAVYRPALEALSPDYNGVIFLHNAPSAIPLVREHCRRATVCLYVHNELFRTYGSKETRRILSDADYVICVSQFVAKRLQARSKGPADNLRVVLNGVDVERFYPRPAEKSDLPVVLFVGRVTPEKGPDLLLKAAAKISDGRRQFSVRIVGSSGFDANDPLTAYERELRAIARPLGDAVEFHPFVDRKRVVEEYQNASIFCAPSNCHDSCPLIVPEAMACGLPVIASRRGGIPEVGGDSVMYFDPPGVERLAEHLVALLDNPGASGSWGARARARAESLSWSSQYAILCAALPD